MCNCVPAATATPVNTTDETMPSSSVVDAEHAQAVDVGQRLDRALVACVHVGDEQRLPGLKVS